MWLCYNAHRIPIGDWRKYVAVKRGRSDLRIPTLFDAKHSEVSVTQFFRNIYGTTQLPNNSLFHKAQKRHILYIRFQLTLNGHLFRADHSFTDTRRYGTIQPKSISLKTIWKNRIFEHKYELARFIWDCMLSSWSVKLTTSMSAASNQTSLCETVTAVVNNHRRWEIRRQQNMIAAMHFLISAMQIQQLPYRWMCENALI